MAIANSELIRALRETAQRLENGADYAWGHHGACNCGNLLQVITRLSKEDIIRFARTGVGEWTELAVDFCGDTNTPVDMLISELQDLGLTPTDIHNLEYLQDKSVLEKLPGGFRWLRRNVREDVILYFQTLADILEISLLNDMGVRSDLNKNESVSRKNYLPLRREDSKRIDRQTQLCVLVS